MIKRFVDSYSDNKQLFIDELSREHPNDYRDLVRMVVEHLPEVNGHRPDPERIHEIDDGDYQGTLVYVIGERGYQPSTYWYVRIYYGSCSGCDTFQSIRGWKDGRPNEEQVRDYLSLLLNITQGIGKMGKEDAW